ncbi:hypothetical protein J2Z66_001522 [Paenibacillus eucommiae]|uniref:Uncharacterized protein n=1 Tax=Paenibacillus eucommiae TaxID=1355755 RepID=A0ABS4ITL8_9BACL|nr:hypothetical protein [Paenibacillus eucommiae]
MNAAPLCRNDHVRYLTMFSIVKASVPGQSVTLMMIFIVKRGQMLSHLSGGFKGILTMIFIVKARMWKGPDVFNDENHR